MDAPLCCWRREKREIMGWRGGNSSTGDEGLLSFPFECCEKKREVGEKLGLGGEEDVKIWSINLILNKGFKFNSKWVSKRIIIRYLFT
jgi:hypothetical protein